MHVTVTSMTRIGALVVLVMGLTARTAVAGDSPELEARIAAALADVDLDAELKKLPDGTIELLLTTDGGQTLSSILSDFGKSLGDFLAGAKLPGDASDSQLLLTAMFLPDPFVAFDVTARNGSDQTERFTLTSNLPIDPEITTETFARAVLDVDLIDANNDGTAEINTVFGMPGLTEFQGVTSDGLTPHLTPSPNDLIGEAISGETNGFMRFDTGAVAVEGPTFDSDSRLIELAPRVEFDLSPGDEVRLRGYYAIDTCRGCVLPPNFVFPAVAALAAAIPEPSSAMLLLTGICSLACRVRRPTTRYSID